MDDSLLLSDFEDGGESSDGFVPKPKVTKVTATKKAAAASKPKAAAKKATQTTLKTTKAPAKKRVAPDSDDENSEGGDSTNDASLLSSGTPPGAKRQKKAPAPKKSSGRPLQEIDNESFSMMDASEAVGASAGAETVYQRLTQLEHILKRPDTYIGSVERTEQEMWVYNPESNAMEYRKVNFVPGLYKIFDEILVNAADNKQRDDTMNEIKVTVDRTKGEISVRNNGKGIPVEMHATDKIYIPEMIFGHLLTSSNYDDDKAKVTGGRNGYGAKLCNIYSTEFTIETQDNKNGKSYKQTWTDNMSKMGKASIKSSKGKDFTMVTFKPDFKKFGMDEMDDDFEALVKRRVYDMAGTCKGVRVYLNGERIAISTFKQYMEMYTKSIKTEDLTDEGKNTQVILVDKPHERWEIGFAVSDGSFQQVSFVNSIATTSGGTHVNYVADQIVTKLMDAVKKRNKGGVVLKNNQIRNHIFLFVNCLINNPAFTSQTKEQMTTKPAQFGSKCSVSEKFLKDIAKTEAVNNIIHFAQKKADQAMSKSDGSRRARMNHSKLTDANKAGTKDGHECILILTEGDSASLLALAGRAVLDPDRIGVFPLRGKLLNVRDASIDQITKNQEIQNIKKFMGLQHKRVYEDTKSLRYGSLMIMTDQDHDGSHIKGLLINFLECQFPSLLKLPGFLKEFITPIVKVWKGDVRKPRQPQSFFTMPEYERWKQEPGNERGWQHKYFKGLGTSQPSDGEVYFKDLDRHLKEFDTMKTEESQLIDLAFSKKKADNRKEWLRNFVPGTFLDMSTAQITYSDFINKELILFSMADNERSIPHVLDGFKPTQRKVLYTSFRRNLVRDVKVVELAGTVMGLTAYSYGEASMQQTITGMAQTFIGSNNVNLLEPSGNFGSRLQGGQDCASARYIYTRLSPFARRVFNPADEALLDYNTDDGELIEPKVYMPVVPMLLINGADGIGTGWSTSIPNYNPEDIVNNLLARMDGDSKDSMTPMRPWFRGWKNNDTIEDIGNGRFRFTGTIEQTKDNELTITELPIRVWTQDFKERLEEILKAEKVPSFIKDYHEYNTPSKVHFVIKLDEKNMRLSLEKGLIEQFKLEKTLATTNLVAFNSRGKLERYETAIDMMEEFYITRLEYYQKRKNHQVNQLEHELEKITNQARFIQMVVDGKLVVSKKKRAALVAELRKLNFKAFPKVSDARKQSEAEPVVENDEAEEDPDGSSAAGARDFDYLLGMAIWSLTQERIAKLLQQKGEKEAQLLKLQETPIKELWRVDLEAFRLEWHTQLEEEAKLVREERKKGRRVSLKLGGLGAKGKKRKTQDDSDDDFAVSKPKAKSQKSAPVKSKSSSLAEFFKAPEAAQSDAMDLTADPIKASAASRAPVPKAKKAPEPQPIRDDDSSAESDYHSAAETDGDDVFQTIAQEAKRQDSAKPVASRGGRVAARKPVNYGGDSDDDDDIDNLLGDVSNLVKGISKTSTSTAPSKSLFTETTSRPSSSGGNHAFPSTSKTRLSIALSDVEDDETDYKNLVPKDSPVKPAARNARDHVVSDEEEEEDSFSQPVAKPRGRPTAAASKIKAPVMKPKKTAVPKSVPEATKPPALSAAAKAYAAKQAKAAKPVEKARPVGRSKAAAKKHVVLSDDEDDNALANDILSDDDEEEEVVRPAARPARRAAASAAKSKYMVADDSEEDEEEASEMSVDDDDDDDEDEDDE